MGNFTLKFYGLEELSTYKIPTNRYQKVRISLYNGEIDICANVQTNQKWNGLNYLHPYIYEAVKRMYIVDLKQENVEAEAAKVFQMFSPGIWLGLTLCVAVNVGIQSVKSYLLGEEVVPSIGREFQRVIGIMTFQGSLVSKRNMISIIEVVSFALPLSILMQCFSNLIFTSIVLYPGYFPPFTDLETLKASGFKFLIQEQSNFAWNVRKIAYDNDENIGEISSTKNDSEHERILHERSELLKGRYIFDAWEVQTPDCAYKRASIMLKTKFSTKVFPNDYVRKYYFPISPRLKPEILSDLEVLNSRAFEYGLNIPIARRRDQVYNLDKFYKSQNDLRCMEQEKSRVIPLPYDQAGLEFFPFFLSTFLFWAAGLVASLACWCCERCRSRNGRVGANGKNLGLAETRRKMLENCLKYAETDHSGLDTEFDNKLEDLFRYIAMKS